MSTKNFFSIFYLQNEFRAKIGFDITTSDKKKSELLNDFFKDYGKYPKLGVFAAGSSAFYYCGNTIDLLGLNNTKMAKAPKNKNGYKDHASFNKKIFFEQKPELINVRSEIYYFRKSYKPLDTIFFTKFEKITSQNIDSDRDFHDNYKNSIIVNQNKKLILKAYIDKKFLKLLLYNKNYKLLN